MVSKSALARHVCLLSLIFMGMTPVSSINFPAALASSESEDAGEARGDADGGRGDKDDRSRDDKDDRSRDDKDDQSKASASHRREFSENQDRIKESTEEHPGYIYSDQLLNFDHTSGDSILLQAETAKRHGDLEKAITLARKSLDMAPGCLDAHAFYAEVLESKLRKQTERDPEMFETCVKEWLIVLRNKVGDEAGMNAHGIAVPFIGTFFEDEEHTIKARQHLIKLTGAAPKGWETDNKYLKKVLTASRESVSGKVVKQKKPKDEFKEELKDEFKGKDEFK